jgi:hypothetical protein
MVSSSDMGGSRSVGTSNMVSTGGGSVRAIKTSGSVGGGSVGGGTVGGSGGVTGGNSRM